MPLVRAYSRNLGQRSILTRKGIFFEKKAAKVLPPYSIPFLNVLHRSKTYNFRKMGQRSAI